MASSDLAEPGDEHIRRAPATPEVVEVTRAGRPWTRAATGRTAQCR
jgi:hypothetical protein